MERNTLTLERGIETLQRVVERLAHDGRQYREMKGARRVEPSEEFLTDLVRAAEEVLHSYGPARDEEQEAFAEMESSRDEESERVAELEQEVRDAEAEIARLEKGGK